MNMAKTYLEIVKYMVESKFNIEGVVDKPDIIGAVFGQTEGLLGSELDLRELQKNGKIGRIEIDVSQSSNRSYGKLHLPASLDRIETCILAAAIESVDRVGPYEAKFVIDKIEDTRSEKRRKVLSRAKELLKILMNTEIPDSKEISEVVQSELRVSEISSYGPEHLPAGPEVGKSDELIIVEGRADVLTLLRNDMANAIAVGGAASNVPKSIISLSREKETTIFVDGDRGGDLIIRSLLNVAEVDFVAKAPDGKEVEDLTRKEIIKAMRSRIPVDQYLNARPSQQTGNLHHRNFPPRNGQEHRPAPAPAPAAAPRAPQQQVQEPESREPEVREQESHENGISSLDESPDDLPVIERDTGMDDKRRSEDEAKPALESVILTQLSSGLEELSGTLRSRLYDSMGNMIKEIPIRELLVTVQETDNVYGIVLDGVITQRLLELAQTKRIKAIYGIKANQLNKRYNNMVLYTKESGKI
jgi:DNA primase